MHRLFPLLLALCASPSIPVASQPEAPGTIPGESMYPRASREVWDHAKNVLQTTGFRTERQDNKHQVLVTQWRNYDADVLPDVGTLGLDPRDRVKKLQLHLMVSPDHEPARVAIGSVVELERREGNRVSTMMGYRVRGIEDWFLQRLDERAGATHESLRSTFEARAEQAKRLGAGIPSCLPQPSASGKASAPVKTSEVHPIFPAQGYSSGPGVVAVQGVVTEHGTLNDLTVVDAAPQKAHFQSSARAAASLWRFRPTIYNGCPVPVSLTVTVNFMLR